jgi:hypothetical protein
MAVSTQGIRSCREKVLILHFCWLPDLTNAKSVLRMADIIDDDGLWIADNDTLVQTGDMVDRGEPLPLLIVGNNHTHTGIPYQARIR